MADFQYVRREKHVKTSSDCQIIAFLYEIGLAVYVSAAQIDPKIVVSPTNRHNVGT